MQRFSRAMMVVFGVVTLLAGSGCDATQQVLDTIGLAGNIVQVWLH